MIREIESKNEVDIEIPLGFIVFCDMDGTLVDTDYANYLSYRQAVIEATCGKHDVKANQGTDHGITTDGRRPPARRPTPGC